MITFLTIFLPILILAVIVVTTMYAFRLNSWKTAFNGNKTTVLVSSYIIILVIGTIWSYSIFPSKPSIGKSISEEDMEKYSKEQVKFKKQVLEKNIFRPDDKVLGKSEKWQIPFKGKNLTITMNEEREESEYYPDILIDNKPGEDGKIEAIAYSEKAMLDGIEFTNGVEMPGIELNTNTLNILPPDTVEVKLAKYNESFAAQQFVSKKPMNERENFFVGEGYIYLKVPKGVKLDGNGEIEYTYVDVK